MDQLQGYRRQLSLRGAIGLLSYDYGSAPLILQLLQDFDYFIMPTTHSKASKPAPGTAKQSVEQPPAANTRSRARQAAAKATAKSTDAKAFEAIDLQSLTPDQGTRIVRQRERRMSAPKTRAVTAADADTALVEAATIAHAADDRSSSLSGQAFGCHRASTVLGTVSGVAVGAVAHGP